MKQFELYKNQHGGIDLAVKQKSSKRAVIQTGNRKRSIRFWEKLRDVTAEILLELESGEGG